MILIVTKEEKVPFSNTLNKRNNTNKFDYEISTRSIAFFDTMVCIEEGTITQATIYHKLKDEKTYLYQQSKHPKPY